jgi:hypothetical protein
MVDSVGSVIELSQYLRKNRQFGVLAQEPNPFLFLAMVVIHRPIRWFI